jgi:hypothetical protein
MIDAGPALPAVVREKVTAPAVFPDDFSESPSPGGKAQRPSHRAGWQGNGSNDLETFLGITLMDTPSPKKIEANRRNAMKSTGPRTAEGKLRSRRNGLRHGLAAEVLVPQEDRAAYDATIARWDREAGPCNVVEEHLIRRAAAGAVRLDRIERARESTREETARKAVRSWEARMQARARKLAQGLDADPSNVLVDLESTAFGCDWLIRQWQAIDATLRLGKGWDQRFLARVHRLLGLPEGLPGPGADGEVRLLWILAAAMSPRSITPLPRSDDEVNLPTEPEPARIALRELIADRVDRLEALREESWSLVEGPERDAIVARALAADTSKEGQLLHRYEVAADRSTNAAIRLFLNNRDRRRKEVLELAREARHSGTLRAPVGGGWWQEVDADPAPPGFQRITTPMPTPTPADSPPAGPDRADADPGRLDPDLGGRSEPKSPEDSPRDPRPNGMIRNELRPEVLDDPSRIDQRTNPVSPPRSDRL